MHYLQVYLNEDAGTGTTIVGNTTYNNGGMGIELVEAGPVYGVTVNDVDDGDTGANNLQNFPVITQAGLSGSDLTLSGSLDTDGLSTQYRIEFFGNVAGTGFGDVVHRLPLPNEVCFRCGCRPDTRCHHYLGLLFDYGHGV